MITDLNQLARKIIEENEYLTMATVTSDSKPWVCILAYVYDKDWNFYFVSLPDSQHSQQVKENNKVAFSIFDSRQLVGKGVGLQIEGEIAEVPDAKYQEVSEIYFGRKWPFGDVSDSFVKGLKPLLKNKTYRYYQITPTKVWINNPEADTDVRVEVNL